MEAHPRVAEHPVLAHVPLDHEQEPGARDAQGRLHLRGDGPRQDGRGSWTGTGQPRAQGLGQERRPRRDGLLVTQRGPGHEGRDGQLGPGHGR